MQPVPTISLTNGVTSGASDHGTRIPQLGLGMARLPEDDEARRIVREAVDIGYRFIDTAASYENEVGVGQGIRDCGAAREDLFVSTKLRGADQGYESAKRALRDSLKRLDLDYVDLYLIHWPLPRVNQYVESWQAMEELLAEGKTRAIGVSNFLPEHLDRLAETSSTVPAVNQIELHPRFPQKQLHAEDIRRGIVTQAWSPLGNGAVLGEPVLAQIGERYGKTPAQVVLRWHVQQGIVTFPKSSHAERLRENLHVFDFQLSGEDMAKIDTLGTGQQVNYQDPRTYEEF